VSVVATEDLLLTAELLDPAHPVPEAAAANQPGALVGRPAWLHQLHASAQIDEIRPIVRVTVARPLQLVLKESFQVFEDLMKRVELVDLKS
jgi:hypothetical protein